MSPSPIPKLGILQLNTTLPRPPGDVGNTASWGDVPVVIRVVKEAESDLVVGGGWGEDLVDAFVREGKRMMEEEGCVAFVTSCGFLATMHPLLVTRLPFMGTSSLLQVGWLQQSFFPSSNGLHSVGVITFNKSKFPDTPVYGLPQESKTSIFKGVLGERIPYDHEGMENEMLVTAKELVTDHPSIRAIVLECTNMPPFSRSVERATGCKVWDILTLGKWLYAGAVPPNHQAQ